MKVSEPPEKKKEVRLEFYIHYMLLAERGMRRHQKTKDIKAVAVIAVAVIAVAVVSMSMAID